MRHLLVPLYSSTRWPGILFAHPRSRAGKHIITMRKLHVQVISVIDTDVVKIGVDGLLTVYTHSTALVKFVNAPLQANREAEASEVS